MNWDQIDGRWLEFKGRVRQHWGRLTNDDLDRIAGKRDRLLGTLQRLYGKSREAVEREVRDFETKFVGDRPAAARDLGSAERANQRLDDVGPDEVGEWERPQRERKRRDEGGEARG